jgi:ParB/RepB/Spo0J family partition protein
MRYQQIALSRIKPSKLNPRKEFNTPEDTELYASVKVNGVIQPILLRPIKDHFEIVFGERRFRAASKVAKANGGLTSNKIPAVVRKLTDDQAFELMTIENSQRKNLSPIEEAKGFKFYVDKIGKDGISALAGRLGTRASYIRKRVAVMELPAKALKAWNNQKLFFGHLEQFLRVDNEKERDDLITNTIDHDWDIGHLKRQVDFRKPHLKDALFDTKKSGCIKCSANSEIQTKLFEIDRTDDARCMKPECYIEKSREHLSENWKHSRYYRKFKTNGFRFYHETKRDEFKTLYDYEPYSASDLQYDAGCKKCSSFVTLVDTNNGYYNHGTVCVNPACHAKKVKDRKAAKRTAAKAAADPNKPRVSWHGEYFREKFYNDRIPEIIDNNLKADGDVTMRLAVFNIFKANPSLHQWFAEKFKIKCNYVLDARQIMDQLKKLSLKDLQQLLKDAVSLMIVGKDFYPQDRQVVAEHLDINLKKEWQPDRQYLNKKNKAELIAMGQEFKIFSKKPAKDYLTKILNKKSGRFDACKKSELIDIFLKSGVNLKGVVPNEILDIK